MSNIKYSRDDIQRILRERGVDWANSKYKSDVINGTNVAITPYTSSTFSEPSKSIGGEPKKHDFMDMGLLSNKTESFGFITFVTRQGKLKITMNQKELNKPIDLGDYTKEDLKSKAKKAIIVKLTEGITRH